jgi:hypothetical protein
LLFTGQTDVRSSKETGFADPLTTPIKFDAIVNTIRRTAP